MYTSVDHALKSIYFMTKLFTNGVLFFFCCCSFVCLFFSSHHLQIFTWSFLIESCDNLHKYFEEMHVCLSKHKFWPEVVAELATK